MRSSLAGGRRQQRCPSAVHFHRCSSPSSSSSSSSSLTRTTHPLSAPAENYVSLVSQLALHSSNERNDYILSTSDQMIVGMLGGDYAGLAATFSSKSGELIPVPHHLIPSSMVEWGDIPSCLEVLTSEDWNVDNDVVENGTARSSGDDTRDDDDDDDDDDEEQQPQPKRHPPLLRTMITVLPEVGCGLDNMEVTKASETFNQDLSDRLECWQYYYGHRSEREVVVADHHRPHTNQQHIQDVETIFQIVDAAAEDEEISKNDIEENDTSKPRPRRIRISFSLDFTNSSTEVLSNIVKIHVERQYSSESTRGTRWTGSSYNSGGLDAQTVMKTIGKGIMYGDVFGVKRMGKVGDYGSRRRDPWLFPNSNITMVEDNEDGEISILEGLWTKTSIHPQATSTSEDRIEVYRTKQDFEQVETSTMATIRLPQNILLRYGSDSSSPDNISWKIEVSHIDTITREGKIHLQRRVVLRSFDHKELVKQAGQKERLGDVSHWVEHKVPK